MADSKLFYAVILLLSIGVVMSYSLGVYITSFYGYSQIHFFTRQLIAACLGIMLMWLLSRIDINTYFRRIGLAIFIISIILMVGMHFLPQGLVSSAGGAKRWIRLSFISLAPSELFKIGFVYFLAWSFSRKFVSNVHLSMKDEIRIFIPYLVLFIVAVVLIAVLQNDLGQVVLLALTLGVMLLFAGGSLRLLGVIFLGTIGTAFLAIITSPHRILRVKSWWASAQDSVLALLPQGWAENLRIGGLPEPYQIYHATNAISSGGFFGSGLGEGYIKLGFLSDVHTDIVLAGITEELGFVGLFGIVLLFAYILLRLFRIANRTSHKMYYLFCVGVALLLGFSLIINAFGISGITPVKGIAVPFLSYGGSSLIANCIAIGLVLAISKNTQADSKNIESA
ncbi:MULTISPECIES: FtsW/RodA/SpoVE family cell cycle protein [Helicobacter]|uniref:Probable peptidoglycan glycosyltransferase FtsW n=2 Tax=Helicobacter typhlonius TaxID=76936 RepID=A0A099UBU0_9HELI|nr:MULTISPECIES: FtsW/RodA/SpoVE family cell cycle protein [Helicobacter]TLD78649.1 cell division protein FtsW [Helicobacter typhlonius]TLD89438.1 cell division protein FtsW [Helicobacter sp. MIT 03-1616]CUU40084.1 Cell division protein FtsW [Helicobacter typhlonius]